MRELKTIEMHTCGEPARIVIDGMPELRGSTMQEKEQDMREHYDNLRTAIIQEPRGHQNMFGIVLTKPCRPEADFGVLFLNGVGYEGMCGHGTICLATAAVVPEPRKGSSTTPPGGQPASRQVSASFGGKAAKCPPLYGTVLICHTSRLLRSCGISASV